MHRIDFTTVEETADSSPETAAPAPDDAARSAASPGATSFRLTQADAPEPMATIIARAGMFSTCDAEARQIARLRDLLGYENLDLDVAALHVGMTRAYDLVAAGMRAMFDGLVASMASVKAVASTSTPAIAELVEQVRAMGTAEERRRVLARERSHDAIRRARKNARHAGPQNPPATVMCPPWARSRG